VTVVTDQNGMPVRLSAEEDAELRWLVTKGLASALTPDEQRRLAALRVRDRRDEVRGVQVEGAIPARLGTLTTEPGGRAYTLSRRLVDLIVASGGVRVILLVATATDPTFEDLVDVLPDEVQPKARELLGAIKAELTPA
jgi:hypothetical protein